MFVVVNITKFHIIGAPKFFALFFGIHSLLLLFILFSIYIAILDLRGKAKKCYFLLLPLSSSWKSNMGGSIGNKLIILQNKYKKWSKEDNFGYHKGRKAITLWGELEKGPILLLQYREYYH